MITLAREKTVEIPYFNNQAKIRIAFKIPTAEEAETKIRGVKDLTDVSLFKMFVLKVSSPDVEGWQNGITADDVVNAPGTFNLISKVALEIVNAAFLTDSEKN